MPRRSALASLVLLLLGPDSSQQRLSRTGAAGDECLSVWRKQAAPAIAAPPKGLRLTGFRDPFVIRRSSPGKPWLLILGSGIKDKGGTILLYQSDSAAAGALPRARGLPAAAPLLQGCAARAGSACVALATCRARTPMVAPASVCSTWPCMFRGSSLLPAAAKPCLEGDECKCRRRSQRDVPQDGSTWGS